MESEHQVHPIRRRRGKRLLLALVVLVGAVLLGTKWLLPTHPEFGAIREATAFDLNEARENRLAVFLRKNLPARIVQSPNFPERFKDQPRYLQLGTHQMEWSIGGTNAGWLYFWGVDPKRGSTPGQWEFAPCAATNLAEVTKAPVMFYAYTNSQVESVFSAGSTTNALRVYVGQVLFARRTGEANRVYVLKFQEQQKNKLVVHYCITAQDGSHP